MSYSLQVLLSMTGSIGLGLGLRYLINRPRRHRP